MEVFIRAEEKTTAFLRESDWTSTRLLNYATEDVMLIVCFREWPKGASLSMWLMQGIVRL